MNHAIITVKRLRAKEKRLKDLIEDFESIMEPIRHIADEDMTSAEQEIKLRLNLKTEHDKTAVESLLQLERI